MAAMKTTDVQHGDIVASLEALVPMLSEELYRVPLKFWNESVFRYFFVRALRQTKQVADGELEWQRHDLRIGEQLVEFKFYTGLPPKGRPAPKNFANFCECVDKLAAKEAAYIVLAYSNAYSYD